MAGKYATHLLSSLDLGGLKLHNRVVLAPLTRGRAGNKLNSRVPNVTMKDYYEQRASAGLMIAEATAISDQGFGWYGAPGCYTKEQAMGWKEVVDGVHAKDGKIFLQLWHMGCQSHSSFHEVKEIVSASPIAKKGEIRNIDYKKVPYEVPRELTVEDISTIVEDYKKSAEFAKLAGFDGVEVHSANGYLPDQFLQSVTNKRTDKYGGSFENRYRFLKEIVTAVVGVYPASRVGVRLSPNGTFGDMGSEDNDKMFPYIASQLKAFGLAYLHTCDGTDFGFHGKCKFVSAYDLKKEFEGPVMGNMGYTRDTADGAIRSGAVDLVAFGRPYIPNPDLVNRFANNWPLAEADFVAYYGDNGEYSGAKGYTDFPFYKK